MSEFPWSLAAILPDEPERFGESVMRAAALGFTRVEVAALADRPEEHLEALAESGVLVACARLSGDLSNGSSAVRREILNHLKRQVEDAARLGAEHCLLSPGAGTAPEAKACFSEGCSLLAQHAWSKRTPLLVLPAAGTCFPDGAAVDDWLLETGTKTLGLALDGTELFALERSAWLRYVRLREGSPTAELARTLKSIDHRGLVGVPLCEP